MRIRQIQVAYEPVHDRLLLRLATTSREEFRIHVTRRFLRSWWPQLTAALQRELRGGSDATAGRGSPGSFAEPYAGNAQRFPLGYAPVLAAEGLVEPAGPQKCNIVLREAKERSVSFVVDRELMQALCSMLRAGSRNADWGLTLDYAAGEASPPREPASGSFTLH
jgi:hypothetical protein